MPTAQAEIGNCRAAIRALDRVLQQQSQELYEDLSEATRHLVQLRDELIRRKRAGGGSDRLRNDLDRVNSILSAMHGSEFPLIGIRRKRIEKVRDHLAELLEQAEIKP